MRSYTNLILLILSSITLILATEGQRIVSSEEEKQDLEKLVKDINKPAIKSFQTEHGYILDCIDIQKQLAFDHPLLTNHTIQLKPKSIPKWTRDNTTSQNSGSLPFRQDYILCPIGTVIVKRVTIEDLIQSQRLKSLRFNYPRQASSNNMDVTGHHLASVNYKGELYGAKGNINIWDPQVSSHQFSIASMSVVGGGKESFQIISAGWIANKGLDHSSLFTYWTADGNNNQTGCYNIVCPGYVHVSTKYAVGTLAQPVSTYGGQQYMLEVSLYQDHVTGNWWLVLRDEPIGYWPKSLFNIKGLADGANIAIWGGEVYSSVNIKSPSMGSGHFAQEGFKKAAFVNGIKVMKNASGKFLIPPASSLKTYATTPKCYNVQKKIGVGDYWSRAMFFGGPGGCTIR